MVCWASAVQSDPHPGAERGPGWAVRWELLLHTEELGKVMDVGDAEGS